MPVERYKKKKVRTKARSAETRKGVRAKTRAKVHRSSVLERVKGIARRKNKTKYHYTQ